MTVNLEKEDYFAGARLLRQDERDERSAAPPKKRVSLAEVREKMPLSKQVAHAGAASSATAATKVLATPPVLLHLPLLQAHLCLGPLVQSKRPTGLIH
jgi:hypothetical protein